MASSQNPGLQRLLATLNGYISEQSQDSSAAQTSLSGFRTTNESASQWNATSTLPGIPGLAMTAPEPQPYHVQPTPKFTQIGETGPGRSSTFQDQVPTESRSRPMTSNAPIPDASTITTWPAALKHVTKHIASNEKASERIKHLISEQHKHERQWWTGREAIVARQEGRSGTSQQISALLKSLGGKEIPVMKSDPKANQKELEMYDRKVYAGLVAMAADFDRQLRALGVPFYAIKHELVVLEEGREKENALKGRVDKGELRELQKRMLQTLEDLFAD